jgi:hypothetical protein
MTTSVRSVTEGIRATDSARDVVRLTGGLIEGPRLLDRFIFFLVRVR